jgi:3-hydroxyacyl-CoA dehydrogenase
MDERFGGIYMNYKNIMVAGTGVLGSQIAFQTAYKGFYVNVYDVSEEVLGHARERLTKLKENYKEDLGATQQAVDEALNRISFYTDLAEAVADADLVVEAIPEVPQIKTAFYKELGRVAPEIGFWHFILPTASGKIILPKL